MLKLIYQRQTSRTHEYEGKSDQFRVKKFGFLGKPNLRQKEQNAIFVRFQLERMSKPMILKKL
jgi:hypothetical protein